MKSILKKFVALSLILVMSMSVIEVQQASAAQLSNESYTYFNDGDIGKNSLKVFMQGKKITIQNISLEAKASSIKYGSSSHTMKKVKNNFGTLKNYIKKHGKKRKHGGKGLYFSYGNYIVEITYTKKNFLFAYASTDASTVLSMVVKESNLKVGKFTFYTNLEDFDITGTCKCSGKLKKIGKNCDMSQFNLKWETNLEYGYPIINYFNQSFGSAYYYWDCALSDEIGIPIKNFGFKEYWC